MTDLTIAIAAIVGAAAGGTMGLLLSWAAGMYGRRPYSSAAIAFRATAEYAAKVRSKIVLGWFAMGATFGLVLSGWPWHPRFSRYSRMQDPDWRRSFNHENTNAPQGPPPFKFRRSEPDPPEQFIRMDEGRIQRGNGSGGTTTPKPNIVPKPQPPGGRVTDVYGRTIGYQPRPQGSTPNPPPTDP